MLERIDNNQSAVDDGAPIAAGRPFLAPFMMSFFEEPGKSQGM